MVGGRVLALERGEQRRGERDQDEQRDDGRRDEGGALRPQPPPELAGPRGSGTDAGSVRDPDGDGLDGRLVTVSLTVLLDRDLREVQDAGPSR